MKNMGCRNFCLVSLLFPPQRGERAWDPDLTLIAAWYQQAERVTRNGLHLRRVVSKIIIDAHKRR
jgi:hypothetical protein